MFNCNMKALQMIINPFKWMTRSLILKPLVHKLPNQHKQEKNVEYDEKILIVWLYWSPNIPTSSTSFCQPK